jgi:hypothetical protein
MDQLMSPQPLEDVSPAPRAHRLPAVRRCARSVGCCRLFAAAIASREAPASTLRSLAAVVRRAHAVTS